MTAEARSAIEAHRSLLADGLARDPRPDWDRMLTPMPFTETPPDLQEIRARLEVRAKQSVREALRLASAVRRQAAEVDAASLYEDETEGFRRRKERHERTAAEAVAPFQSVYDGYERGDATYVEMYFEMVLSDSPYPDPFSRAPRVEFLPDEHLLIAEFDVPRQSDIPAIGQYRFDAERGDFVSTRIPEAQVADLFDEVVYQSVLRTAYELFTSDERRSLQQIVVNAYSVRTNPGTGRDARACVATCGVGRGTFDTLDLARVTAGDCFRTLNGIAGRRPSSPTIVQPIRAITRDADETLGINAAVEGASEDLLQMDPFAFEELIGALFRRIYEPEHATVEVTQASRDGGVDVVVKSPDTIKGGRTVIQVKRYNGVIGVGYVRELYGTMISSGATKGILIGTGHYGADARTFADGKPMTLVDGDTLLQMLSEHGWNYRIGS